MGEGREGGREGGRTKTAENHEKSQWYKMSYMV